jgi:hypothetical protein
MGVPEVVGRSCTKDGGSAVADPWSIARHGAFQTKRDIAAADIPEKIPKPLRQVMPGGPRS